MTKLPFDQSHAVEEATNQKLRSELYPELVSGERKEVLLEGAATLPGADIASDESLLVGQSHVDATSGACLTSVTYGKVKVPFLQTLYRYLHLLALYQFSKCRYHVAIA